MNKSDRHHYVPKFLLKNWCPNGEHKVWCYEKGARGLLVRRRSPKEILFERGLYAFQEPIYDHKMFPNSSAIEDDFFAKIDSDGASAIHKLNVDGLGKLSGEDRVRIAIFINVLLERSPKRLACIKQEAINERLIDCIPIPYALKRLASLDMNAVAGNALLNSMVEQILDKPFIDHLMTMKWDTFAIPNTDWLVTSDSPVVLNAGSAPFPIYTITFATSPQKLLIVHAESDALGDDVVKLMPMLYNLTVIRQSEKYVIASKKLADTSRIKFTKILDEWVNGDMPSKNKPVTKNTVLNQG